MARPMLHRPIHRMYVHLTCVYAIFVSTLAGAFLTTKPLQVFFASLACNLGILLLVLVSGLNYISPCSSIIYIKILDHENAHQRLEAILDTGSIVGNWISQKAVTRLGFENEIDTSMRRSAKTFTGSKVNCLGSISLEWILDDGGRKVHTTQFYVGASDDIGIILGNHFIQQEGAVIINKWALATLLPHKPITPDEEADKKRIEQQTQKEKEQVKADKEQRATDKAARNAAAAAAGRAK